MMDITPTQLKALAATARKAYDHLRELDLTDDSFDVWRKRMLRNATGLTSFKGVSQETYHRAISIFKACLGEGQAERETSPRVDNPLRQARWWLQKTVDDYDFDRDYVVNLSADKFKVEDLRLLDRNQIWQLVYTLRNRAKTRGKPR